MCSSGTQLFLVLRYHILERVNCVLRISRLYAQTAVAACTKRCYELLKNGLLGLGESLRHTSTQTSTTHEAQVNSIECFILEVSKPTYSNPMIQPEPEGSTQGYLLVSVEVLRSWTSGRMHNPSLAPLKVEDFVSKLTEIHTFLSTLSLRVS
ncbi:hypothetical protein Tco_0073577 [Tanacetum coccineum]